MIRVLQRAIEFVDGLAATSPQPAPLTQLRAVARWTMEVQLAGEMPSLPAQNSSLRQALVSNSDYMNRLFALSDKLGTWITEAQSAGSLNRSVPAEVVLYTLFARACDPVLGLLKAGGQYSDEQIIEYLLSTCFDGLAAHPAA